VTGSSLACQSTTNKQFESALKSDFTHEYRRLLGTTLLKMVEHRKVSLQAWLATHFADPHSYTTLFKHEYH